MQENSRSKTSHNVECDDLYQKIALNLNSLFFSWRSIRINTVIFLYIITDHMQGCMWVIEVAATLRLYSG